MEIIVPKRIHTVTALCRRTDQLHLLWLILADENNGALTGCLPYLARYRRENVIGGFVVNVLRGIQSQPIQMKLANPVTRVGDEELPHRPAVLVIEVDRFTPV